jgi:hypothetical protein
MTDDGWQTMYLGLKADVARIDGRVDIVSQELRAMSVAVLAALTGITDRLDAHAGRLEDIVARLERMENGRT